MTELNDLRARMRAEECDALLLRSTDGYLNESVSLVENECAYYSGFTGSTSELLVTQSEAYLFVDGRYYLQAEQECDAAVIEVVRIPAQSSSEKEVRRVLGALVGKGEGLFCLGFDRAKLSVSQYFNLRKACGARVRFLCDGPLLPFLEVQRSVREPNYHCVPSHLIGKTRAQILKDIHTWLAHSRCDFLFVSEPENLAYLCQLRASDIPYSSAVKGCALLGFENIVFLDTPKVPGVVVDHCASDLTVYPESKFHDVCSEVFRKHYRGTKPLTLTFDYKTSSYRFFEYFHKRFHTILTCLHNVNPLFSMKSLKTPQELKIIRRNCHQTDKVFTRLYTWIKATMQTTHNLSEATVSAKIKALFTQHGATTLSFEPIVACSEHAAIVHYTRPNAKTYLRSGDLLLVDCGAYFQAGYASDMTRTFHLGPHKAHPTQKKIYTLVLKAFIQAMVTFLPQGSNASQLDSIVRASLWRYLYDFRHGTGHGIGVSVHESPPAIHATSKTILHDGMVFSIEPGIYIQNFGGVRLENLVVVQKTSKKNWLRLRPLSFSHFDTTLIEDKYLDYCERRWLYAYQRRSKLYLQYV